jgi:hypothetical protein
MAAAPATAIADGQVTLSPAAGGAGTSVVVQGAGFPASRHVAVGLGARTAATVVSSRSGAFRVRLTISHGRSGPRAVVSHRGRVRVVNTFFATRAGGAGNVIEVASSRGGSVRATPASVSPAGTVHLTGKGFGAGRRLTLLVAGARYGVTTGRGGRFAMTFQVPGTPASGFLSAVLTGAGRRLRVRLAIVERSSGPANPVAPVISSPTTPAAPPVSAIGQVALWHMDEMTGTVMHDSARNHQGTLHSVTLGVAPGFGSAGTAYGFATRSFVSVPSAGDLNPGDLDITLTVHMRTALAPPAPAHDWDLVRKGVFATSGGEFKMEYQPTGKASCGFKGSQALIEILDQGPALSDGLWHTVQCVKTATAIKLVVDGQTYTKSGVVGAIANNEPVVIGSHGGTSEFFRGALDEVGVVIG